MNKGYAICLNEWLEDERITNELRLLLKISSLSAKDGHCYASNEFFADYFNFSKITASRQIKKLERLGFIKVEYEKRGAEIKRRNIYLTSSREIAIIKNDNRRLTQMITDDYQNCKPTIITNDKENNISINNISINNISPLSPYELFKNETNYQDETYLKINDWLIYKKEKRQSYKERGLKGLFTMLKKNMAEYGEEAVCNLIDESMANGYQGIMWDRLARTHKQTKQKWQSPTTKVIKEILKEEYEQVTSNRTFYNDESLLS